MRGQPHIRFVFNLPVRVTLIPEAFFVPWRRVPMNGTLGKPLPLLRSSHVLVTLHLYKYGPTVCVLPTVCKLYRIQRHQQCLCAIKSRFVCCTYECLPNKPLVGTLELLILLLVQSTVAGTSVKTCTVVVTCTVFVLYCCCFNLFCDVLLSVCVY